MASSNTTIKDFKQVNGQISSDRLTYSLSNIVSKNANGKDIEWQISLQLVQASDPTKPLPIKERYLDNEKMDPSIWAVITVDSGLVTGKTREIVPTYVKVGKNLGKKSETNVMCQAIRDMIGLHNKHLRKASVANADSVGVQRYLPMLAKVYKDNKQHVAWKDGVHVQRKFNGIRVIATLDNDAVIMYSRSSIVYPGFAKIKEALLPMFKAMPLGSYLDGEMYSHNLSLQDISGYSRKQTQVDNPAIHYMLYDMFNPNTPALGYERRYDILTKAFKDSAYPERVELVQSYIVHSEEAAEELYKSFLQEKYEGAILRQNMPYEHSNNNYRSNSLMKLKPTYDTEAKCIGWDTGKKGKAAASIMFVCELPAGQFNVTPAMTTVEREALAAKMNTKQKSGKTYFEEQYKDKMLIIYFDEYSKTGIPQRARTDGIIRDYE